MEAYLGMIAAFGFNFAPRGWMLCYGQLLSISQNSALFALLGTTYGGNGQTTFALPNLQGRTAIGQGPGGGLSPYAMGQMSGSESITLQSANMPVHAHIMPATAATQAGTAVAANGDASTPENNYLALSPKIGSGPNATQLKTYATTAATPVKLGGGAISTASATTGQAGGSVPISIIQPYLAINYCIALTGIFPSRN